MSEYSRSSSRTSLRDVLGEQRLHKSVLGLGSPVRPLTSPEFIKDMPCARDEQGVVLTLSSPSSGAKVTVTSPRTRDRRTLDEVHAQRVGPTSG